MSLTSRVGKIRHLLERGWHVSASDRADVPAQQGNRLGLEAWRYPCLGA